MSLYTNVTGTVATDAAYYAGLAEKGAGAGSAAGAALDRFTKYMNLVVAATNVYNFCAVDYYLISISTSVSSVSGGSNQLVNLLYRFFDPAEEATYLQLSTATSKTSPVESDYTSAGEAFGSFTKNLLAVEIPDSTATPSYTSVGGIA
mgnify:CR=1 FL=1